MKRVGTEPQKKKTTTFKKAKPVNFINYLRIICEISVLSFENVLSIHQ